MFVTFYSYKGGVGRSLALANIACLLAEDSEHPQRVLLWDFDLEAPGLHRLFPPRDPQLCGFVDLAYEFANKQQVPDFRHYVYQSQVKGIDVLPAGKVDQAYCERLQSIDWSCFFSDSPHDPGPFFGPLVDSMKKDDAYDYVLIDSRTGLNDQAGICTQVLPDLIVVLLRLNDQNLDGLSHVIPAIRKQLAGRNRTNVEILPIASVVSATSSEGLRHQREEALNLFGAKRLGYIRFDANLVVEERLFCLAAERDAMWPLPPIIEDYETTCRAIRRQNQSDTRTSAAELQRRLGEGDYASAASLLLPLVKRRPQLPFLWDVVEMLDGTRDLPREPWEELVDSILERDRDNVFCHEWKALSCVREAKSPESDALQEAKTHLERAAQFDPQRLKAFHYLASLNSCLGDLEGAVVALRKCRELSPENVQVLRELAGVHVRMGANYFAVAVEQLGEVRGSSSGRMLVDIALLRAFLGEQDKAAKALEAYDKGGHGGGWHYVRTAEAQVCLLSGDREGALQVARRSLADSDHTPDQDDLLNWAEFYVCAEDFEKAVETAVGAEKSEGPSEQQAKALIELAKHISGPEDCAQRVLRQWSECPDWGFTELLVFRERVLREKRDYGGRLSIIEDIIREQELRRMRSSRVDGSFRVRFSPRTRRARGSRSRA